MATNRRLVTAENSGKLYSTPRWATRALLERETFDPRYVHEPCCGQGAISNVMEEYGYSVYSSDITTYDYVDQHEQSDFMNWTEDKMPIYNIVTNPPYSIATDFTHRALKLARNKVCLLLRLAFLEGVERYHTLFSKDEPSRVHVFSERVSMYPDGQEKDSGGTTAYGWFVWDRKAKARGTEIHWIEPGYKPKGRKNDNHKTE